MAQKHLSSGDSIHILSSGNSETVPAQALFKDKHMEVMRLSLPAAKHIATHQVDGPITIFCIEGQVEIQTDHARKILHTGDLMYLAASASHALTAIDDSSLLVTIALQGSAHQVDA
ncbi:cupin domain-containing protein [Undibacterium sp. WLX3042]|uniref:cupin domain-containing protein n=1 Tax=Undibacterium sp. WLX3042 TaxID=3412686 RepID=UPI003C2E0C14